MLFFLTSKHRALWIGALGLVALPLVFQAIGLTLDSATVVVILAVAAMGLNLLVGYTGLVSFGHAAWFGIGGYAAGLAQLHWFKNQMLLPMLFSVLFTATLSLVIGFLILRRRGVYFSLLTLALCALTFAISFRWTSLTGGEGGLGGIERATFGPIDLNGHLSYYVFAALIGFAVLVVLHRVVRSPFGHVLVAIRENQQRATFQGYNVERYKLVAFVLSATVTGLAGSLMVFLHRLAAAESTAVHFSGELLAMVVIGGMHSFLGPALGAVFFLLFRELFSMWTDNWLLWFGLIFVGFIIFSPSGLTGIWGQIHRRLRPPPEDGAAMSKRKIYEGLPLPEFLRPKRRDGAVLEASDIGMRFGGIQAVRGANLTVQAGQIHALIGPNGAGKTTTFNLISGMFPPSTGSVHLHGQPIHALAPDRICQQGLARSFQITNLFFELPVRENLRLAAQGTAPRHALNCWHAPQGARSQAEVVASLQKALKAGLADPAMRARLEGAGIIAPTGDENLSQIIRTDMGKYAELVKFARITPEN